MAARRGKSQARRNHGNGGGLPVWAWVMIGLLLGIALVLAAPRLLKSDGDGFFRPRPDPDAQPEPVALDADDVVASRSDAASGGTAAKSEGRPGDPATGRRAEYDFYTLLPGKEVALSDAELAATERAETQRAAQQEARTSPEPATTVAAAASTAAEKLPLPAPVSTAAGAQAPTPRVDASTASASASVAAPADDDARYLLQAGAFQASGQAEELKARIALLGLGARVESASIGGNTVYRVRMGPYGTAGELADAKRKLASGGLPGMAIKVK